jgi:adenine/guanine phosphoribosyltransferase-like PRPP-binding protein
MTTPVPRTLYIHDDLSNELRARGEPAQQLGAALFERLRGDARIVVLTLDEQLDALVARGGHAPFAAAVGIGRAGARVAAQVHGRTGWFPQIHAVDLCREEDEAGGYVLAGSAALAARLAEIADVESVAVVDDTIFSGLTMRAVLDALPPRKGRRVHAFCLRAVADSLPGVAALAPVSAGVAAAGRILEDVSLINASGLVHRGAIRRTGQASLAFFERPEWMEAWFPGYTEDIVKLCRELHEVVEAPRVDRVPRTRRGSPAPSARPGSHRPGSSPRRSTPGR